MIKSGEGFLFRFFCALPQRAQRFFFAKGAMRNHFRGSIIFEADMSTGGEAEVETSQLYQFYRFNQFYHTFSILNSQFSIKKITFAHQNL